MIENSKLPPSAFFVVNIDKAASMRRHIDNQDHWEMITHEVLSAIQDELPVVVAKELGLSVKADIITVREGSLIVIGSLLVGISQYKDFIESLQLIRTQFYSLLHNQLRNEPLEIDVQFYEMLTSPRETSNNARNIQGDRVVQNPSYHGRNLFLNFFFILSIAELLIIGLLVFKAVCATYHW